VLPHEFSFIHLRRPSFLTALPRPCLGLVNAASASPTSVIYKLTFNYRINVGRPTNVQYSKGVQKCFIRLSSLVTIHADSADQSATRRVIVHCCIVVSSAIRPKGRHSMQTGNYFIKYQIYRQISLFTQTIVRLSTLCEHVRHLF